MRNPFRPNKFELDNRPLIWVAPIARRIMEQEGSVFVAGARGTGKTSILKAIESLEQTRNASLRAQIKPFRYNSVAIYMRAQDLFTQSFNGVDWVGLGIGKDARVVEYTFMAAIIEAEASAKLAALAAEWRVSGVVTYRAQDALKAVERLQKLFPHIFRQLELDRGDPVSGAATALAQHRKTLAIRLVRSDGEALGRLLQEEPLELIRAVTAALGPLFATGTRDQEHPLSIKIAIDECDYFTPTQQIALNSLVRKTAAPVSFVLAYVDSDYDPSTTVFKNLSLSGADRAIYDLAYEQEDDFAELCEAIVSYRVFYSQDPHKREKNREEAAHAFKLEKKLGQFSINDLLHRSLADRPGSRNSALITRAENLRDRFEGFTQKRMISQKTLNELGFAGVSPPIYQQFIIERLGFDAEASLLEQSRKEAFLATLRRKQRAAMLQVIFESKRQKLPYYGKRVLLALADSSVRDFLDIMAEIYDQEDGDGRGAADRLMSGSRIDIDNQRQGAEAAADKKYSSIEHRPSLEPGTKIEVPDREGQLLTRAIDALGRLTHHLQVSRDGIRSITTAERGIFVFDLAIARQIEALRNRSTLRLEAILARGIRDNYLVADEVRLSRARTVASTEPTVIRFRLHRRFAPRFRFSFLGAIEDVRLPPDAMIELLTAASDFNSEDWAKRTAARMTPDDDGGVTQRDLFLGSATDD